MAILAEFDDDPLGIFAEARAAKEEADERDWIQLIGELREFAERHGWPAACRALGEAMNPQAGMFRG